MAVNHNFRAYIVIWSLCGTRAWGKTLDELFTFLETIMSPLDISAEIMTSLTIFRKDHSYNLIFPRIMVWFNSGLSESSHKIMTDLDKYRAEATLSAYN